jgi:uncharacterized LabA/DUF88 family protein
MSKNVAMFVDVANMYYAARGQDVDVDYVALLKHATKGRDLIRAYAYTGLDPENENQRKFIDFLAKNGYKPVVKDIRKFGDGRMKANLDIELVVDLFRLADRMDIAVIVSGDGDFAPAIRALQDKGVRAEVISFKPNTSSDLIAVADEFQDIMKVASISRKKAAEAVRDSAAGMSMPEMPAKEVTPEFGFREASPSVAAAALAALKGGGSTGGRGRAGAGRRTTPAAAEAPLAAAEQPPGERVAVPVGEAGAETEAGRRRRRRGGRGRGRGRREEGAAAAPGDETPVDPAAAPIGWEEFDDISQLEGAGDVDREYSFEEADAATLAELGLTPDDAAAETEAPAKPTRSRSPRAKAGDAAKADGSDAGDGAPKPRTRAPRSRAAAKPASGEETGGDEADAAPRRASRPRKSDAEAAPASDAKPASSRGSGRGAAAKAPAGDEPQGIWGRFRSARKPPTGG